MHKFITNFVMVYMAFLLSASECIVLHSFPFVWHRISILYPACLSQQEQPLHIQAWHIQGRKDPGQGQIIYWKCHPQEKYDEIQAWTSDASIDNTIKGDRPSI